MSVELKVPSVGESVSEVEVGEWLKREGDPVRKDEAVVVIETDKATMEIFAPTDGVLGRVLKPAGTKVGVGDVIGSLAPPKEGISAAAASPAPPKREPDGKPGGRGQGRAPRSDGDGEANPADAGAGEGDRPRVMPSAARAMAEQGISLDAVEPTGPGGRVLKEDVLRVVEGPGTAAATGEKSGTVSASSAPTPVGVEGEEEVVRMSLIRRKIAERLIEAQQTMALLTTFNEIDMSDVIALRKQLQEEFVERYQVKLGFMSFFVKSTVEALKDCPGLNAEIRGESIAYRNYFNIGVAIGGGRGLVVPVLRHAERLGFAEIEQAIGELARRVKENSILPEDLQGGTFTITNGGVYGSVLSTPLINAPQSGVLGMHAIQDRPVVVAGEIVVRPIMNLALTYDHRVVDGREAVTFLRRIKELIEQPARMLLEV